MLYLMRKKSKPSLACGCWSSMWTSFLPELLFCQRQHVSHHSARTRPMAVVACLGELLLFWVQVFNFITGEAHCGDPGLRSVFSPHFWGRQISPLQLQQLTVRPVPRKHFAAARIAWKQLRGKILTRPPSALWISKMQPPIHFQLGLL